MRLNKVTFWAVFLGLVGLFILGEDSLRSRVAANPPQQKQAENSPQTWAGFLKNEILPKLPNQANLAKDQPFKVGLIADAKSLAAVAKADTRNSFPQKWLKEIDWNKEVVVYVVLTNSTNSLKFGSWKQDQQGTGTLVVRWIGIEPFYQGFQAGFLYRVPKTGLKTLSVHTDRGPLTDIKLGK